MIPDDIRADLHTAQIAAIVPPAEVAAEPAMTWVRDRIIKILRINELQLLRDYDADPDLAARDPEFGEAITATADAILAAIVPPAMPPLAEVIAHYGIDALCNALAPEIVREAGEPPAPWMPPEDRPDTYQCLGLSDDEWVLITWRRGAWRWTSEDGAIVSPIPVEPAAFAPLPGDAV